MKPLLLFLFLLSPLSSLLSQPHTWPPGGTMPTPYFGLPEGRTLSSSKRWNLVWADQIVPTWVSDSQVAFAARNYVGTQKIFADQAALFRAINPNFIVLSYHLAAGLNPLHNSDAPDPKTHPDLGFIGVVAPEGYVSEYTTHFLPWLDANGITPRSARYEEMFQHYDTADSAHRVWHQDPYWLMNVANDDWRSYVAETVRKWMEGNSNEGCFFDVVVETNVSLYNPKGSNPAPRDFDWWLAPHGPADAVGSLTDRTVFAAWQNERWLRYFQNVYRSFHRATVDRLVLPNVDQMVTTVYDPIWLDGDQNGETVDGAMMENFGGYTGFDMWQTLERGVRHLTSRGKVLIAQFDASTSAERLRRVAMFMLIKNESSYLNIINSTGVEWYPEYEIDLGDQTPLPSSFDAMRASGETWRSLWRRDYERGIVLVNTGDAPLDFTLPPGTWERIETDGGGAVNSDGTMQPQEIRRIPVSGTVSVSASDGLILSRVDGPSGTPYQPTLPGTLDLSMRGK